MRVRAIIFDVYKTLLKVGPPPANAEELWQELQRRHWPAARRIGVEEFQRACEALIAREHQTARLLGIAHPEIFWPDITRAAFPPLAELTEAQCDDFLFEHAQLVRSITLWPGAADALAFLAAKKLVLGIASNAQPYTVRELARALESECLSLGLFEPDLCFWSFQAGFSKPDPHVFRWLGARLHALRIAPGEVLMIGDRADNDIAPARAQGWQTWHFSDKPASQPGGPWRDLMQSAFF